MTLQTVKKQEEKKKAAMAPPFSQKSYLIFAYLIAAFSPQNHVKLQEENIKAKKKNGSFPSVFKNLE